MSTLRVDNLQSYSGGNITLNNQLIGTSSYALVAETALNAGADLSSYTGSINQTGGSTTLNGDLTVQGANINLPYDGTQRNINIGVSGSSNYTIGGFDFGGQSYGQIYSVAPGGFQIANGAATGSSVLNLRSDNGNINLNADNGNIGITANSNISLQTGTNGNINTVADGFRIQPNTTASFNSIQMSSFGNFFSDFYGFIASENRLSGSANNGNSNATVGAQNKASFTLNAFPTTGAYDELFEITVDANGATFQDWVVPTYTPTPWFNVPQQGTPAFKRGLAVTGSVAVTEAINLTSQDPLPSGSIGDLAVSGSSLYFYNGAWTLVV